MKSCLITNAATQVEIVNEVEIALKFTVSLQRTSFVTVLIDCKGETGLIQASYVSCHHRHYFGPGQYERKRAL